MLWNFSRLACVHTICYLHVLLPESTLNLKNSNGMHETPMLRHRLQTNCNGWMDRKRKWIQAVLRWELNCNWFQYRLPSPPTNLFPLSSASINPHSVSFSCLPTSNVISVLQTLGDGRTGVVCEIEQLWPNITSNNLGQLALKCLIVIIRQR
jgi:hypothetical protein